MARPDDTLMSVPMSKLHGQHLTSLAVLDVRVIAPSMDAPLENHFESSSKHACSLASNDSPIATSCRGISYAVFCLKKKPSPPRRLICERIQSLASVIVRP